MSTPISAALRSDQRKLVYQLPLREDFKLLEVNEKLLEELLTEGLVIKGEPDEEAVLCSRNNTYALKKVETTNLVLLVPPKMDGNVLRSPLSERNTAPARTAVHTGIDDGLLTQMQQNDVSSSPVSAVAKVESHMELQLVAPRMHKLDQLLQVCPFCDGEGDADDRDHMDVDDGAASATGANKTGYTFEELLSQVQASESELKMALESREAIVADGLWRSVDERSMDEVVQILLYTAVQYGWSDCWEIPARQAVEAMKNDFDIRLVAHVLRVFGEPKACPGVEELPLEVKDCEEIHPDVVYRLDARKVSLHFAKGLLKTKACWSYEQFTEEWTNRVPEGMPTTHEVLRGEALRRSGPEGELLESFPARQLTTDPAARFAILFKQRPRWEWEDLEPYVMSLQAPGQSVEALLLKYTRAVQPRASDPVVYTAR